MKMKSKFVLVPAVAIASLIAFVAVPVFAQGYFGTGVGVDVSTSVSSSVSGGATSGGTSVGIQATLDARITTHANQEIDRRITALDALQARVNQMVKVSADAKTSISAALATEITDLTNLKAKVAADSNDITALRADAKSITASYRIFALVIPRTAIDAAADRVETIVGTLQDVSTKLQAKITAAQTSGTDVSAFQADETDMNAKISDANVQVQAAVSAIASLQPDNGDKNLMASNTQALKAARAKIKTAHDDLIAARDDAQKIIVGLKIDANASASATSSATSSSQ